MKTIATSKSATFDAAACSTLTTNMQVVADLLENYLFLPERPTRHLKYLLDDVVT